MPVSQWALETFGQRAPVIRQGIADALSTALDNAREAQAAARTDHTHPFGFTLMSRKFEALAETFEDMGGVRVVKPAGSPHELVLLGGKLLFPFRYARDRSVSVMSARIGEGRPSALVQALFHRFGPEPVMRQLTLHDVAPHAVPVAEALTDLPADTELVLIAYACNAHAGLLDAWWGEAELLDRTGSLRWHHCEPIPLPAAGQAGLTPLPATAFDQGAVPAPALNPRTGAARLVPPVAEPTPITRTSRAEAASGE
ncbi:hypothetical protein MF672_003330 [Actinomadura sp. ATCC 31491]|uniref:Uncharacterized protein n=1 Tax=Actinomadura luzonensis TaxID=2805427 RepID=A0ABT0FKP9_9ACTN|nr:hypothetical protein [Actinomadura luzonensis]MCK2212834.1 hypothetical protein [Actinomadura luzonensis]